MWNVLLTVSSLSKEKNNLVSFIKNITHITPSPTMALRWKKNTKKKRKTNQTWRKLCWPSTSRLLVFRLWCCALYFMSVYIWRARPRRRHSVIQQQLLMCAASDLRLKEPAHIRAGFRPVSPELRADPTQSTSSDVGCFVSCAHAITLHISRFSLGLSSVSTDPSEPVTQDLIYFFVRWQIQPQCIDTRRLLALTLTGRSELDWTCKAWPIRK